jgi:hypothetical protein
MTQGFSTSFKILSPTSTGTINQLLNNMTDSSSKPTQEQIARRAYEIFIERGQPEGRDLEHWLEAEKQLRASSQTKSTPVAATASTPAASATMTPPARGTQPVGATNGRGNGRTRSTAAARK